MEGPGAPNHHHGPPVPEIPHLAPDAPHAPLAVHASARDRFGRLLIALVVTATFLGAAVAVLHSYSLARAHQAGLAAQSQGAAMAGAFLKRQEEGHAKLEWAARAEDARTRIINLTHRRILRRLGLLPSPASSGQPEHDEAEIGRLDALARHLDRVSGLTPGSADSPGRDPNFPERFMVRGTQAVYQRAWHMAMQDAYNDLSVAWRVRAGWYTACLTAYAVAVYLFSLALVITNQAGATAFRREAGGWSSATRKLPAAVLFSTIAAGLMVMATAAALTAAVTSPRETRAIRTAEQAATEYAKGVQTMTLASTSSEYKAAAEHFRLALQARASLVHAHSALATSLFLEGSPQTEERFVSMTAPDKLKEAQRSAEAAWRRGLRRSGLLVDLGWNAFLAGLESAAPDRRRLVEDSIRYTEEAARRDPDDDVAFANLGLAALLLSRPDESERYYDEALVRSRFARADGNIARTDADLRDRVVSNLTDLELVRTFQPELGEAIDRRKAWIIKRAWPGAADGYASRGVRIPNVTIAVSSTAAQWDASTEQVNPKEDVLVAIWYLYREYRPGKWVWHAIPALSGRVEVGDDGRFRRSRSYATTPYRCLQSGRFKVELYVNGQLAGAGPSDDGTVTLPELDHREFPDLSLRLCYPKDWRPTGRALAGLVQGFESADGARAVHMFRLRYPWGKSRARADVERYVGWALEHLGLRDAKRREVADGAPFLDTGFTLIHTRLASYDHAGGRARVGLGVSGLGSVVIGVVHGPGAFADDDLARSVLASMR
jgi:tetratricopeptide (TPR) repeat protein